VKILPSDIDALIEAVEYIKNFADIQILPADKAKFDTLAQHVRKVYILLLNATEKGQMELKRLCDKGIPDNTDTAAAIRTLCPNIGQN
jgi:hypothetical protein